VTALKINPEFKDLIPPLAEEELEGLSQSIQSQGCRDTIKIWRGTIVDGHNRYAICRQHDIPFTTTDIRFASKKDAALWIIENQLGRRNLSKAARIKLAMHKIDVLREQARLNRAQKGCEPVHVRKAIAAQAKVSEGTVQRYMRIIKEGSPELIAQVESGEKTIGTACRLLEVKTVEPLCVDGPIIPVNKTSNPFAAQAVGNSLAWVEKVYKFILSQPWFVSSKEDTAPVKKLLRHHRKVVRAMSDRLQ